MYVQAGVETKIRCVYTRRGGEKFSGIAAICRRMDGRDRQELRVYVHSW